MSILSTIFIKLTSQHVATDSFGNRYYQSQKTDYLGLNKRYVIYKDSPEPSSVEPMFHAWLHHLSDEIPNKDQVKEYSWQKDFKPNLTGTKLAYSPLNNNKRAKVSADYQPFQPNVKIS